MNGKTGKGSAYGWLFQRITGLFLAFFLILHTQMLHFTKDWKIDFNVVTQRLDSTGWVIFYAIFVPAELFHAFNVVCQVVHDYRPSVGTGRAVKAFFWVLGLAISAWGYYLIATFSKGA